MTTKDNLPQTEEQARTWLRDLEAAWVECEPCELVLRYTMDCDVRQGEQQGRGREAVRRQAERIRERDEFCHSFELWTFEGRRIAAVVSWEWWDDQTGYWFRGHGNARFELDDNGKIALHDVAMNTEPIPIDARKLA